MAQEKMAQEKVELVSREQIEERAYELYLQSGCVEGRDVENWLAAEEELQKSAENRGTADEKNRSAAAQRGRTRGRLTKSAAN